MLWQACSAGNKKKPNLRSDNAHTHANSINDRQNPKIIFTFSAEKFGSLKIVTNFALAIEKYRLQTSIMVR